MVFEEICCLRVDKINKPFIYFLIKKNEVVYVGQTKVGLQRPLSHTDKDFDYIMIQYCDKSDLNEIESKYIVKYNPIYNKTYNKEMWYSMGRSKNIIRKKLNDYKFNIPQLRNVMEKNNIKSKKIFNSEVLYINDLYKLMSYLKGEKYATTKRF